MARPVTPLDAFGRSVSKALGAYAKEREQALETARRGFLETALRAPAPRASRARVGVLLAAAVVLVFLAGGIFVERARRPLTFTADGRPALRETWLSAAAERPLPLEFSDGTRFRVEPSSRVRVLDVDRHGASVALENGTLHAEVVHRPKGAWRVIAGPLTVRVTGTRFDLYWSAVTEEFVVSVSEGSVVVAGSFVGSERAVGAGETLRVRIREKRLALANSAELAELRGHEAVRAEPPQENADSPALPRTDPPPSTGSAVAQLTPREDWRELARRGLLRKAFAAAETSGFDAACQTATPAELLELGDAARLSGRPDRANQALLALRTRHPSDPRRAAAAFALGKVAFDQSGAYAQAAEWFSTSLREQPKGSLSREAAGRLVEAYQRAGNAAAAHRAAKDYLARYPDGPHADVARSIVR